MRHIQTDQILALGKFLQNGTGIADAQAAAARHVHAGQFTGIEHIRVQMHDKFARLRVQQHQRILRRFIRAFRLNVRQRDVAHGRTRQEILLRRVQPLQAEQHHVRLANQRAFAPKAGQFGRSLADDIRHDHAVDPAGGRACRSV